MVGEMEMLSLAPPSQKGCFNVTRHPKVNSLQLFFPERTHTPITSAARNKSSYLDALGLPEGSGPLGNYSRPPTQW